MGELSPGERKLIEAEDETLVLVNAGGRLYAINNECTHAACDLADGTLDGHTIECPCHGSRFDVTTGAVESPPALDPVPTYTVRVDGDNVLIGPA